LWRFYSQSIFKQKFVGEILNVGTGKAIRINKLAKMICEDNGMIERVPHYHLQAAIQRLLCNSSKARKLLD
jgi:nucleoside-diphosphate-sugar epimerase